MIDKEQWAHAENLVGLILKYKADGLDLEEFNEVACPEIKQCIDAFCGTWLAIQQVTMDTMFIFRSDLIVQIMSKKPSP